MARRRSRSRPRQPSTGDALWDDPSVWSEEAEQVFARAIRRGRWELLVGRLRGTRATLLSFEEATRGLPVTTPIDLGTCTVPLAKVVGSVNKDGDFTRSFHPVSEALRARWKRAYAVARGMRGYHPVELYQLGDTYFVLDGHFRVSVARELGSDSIRARVRSWLSTGPRVGAGPSPAVDSVS